MKTNDKGSAKSSQERMEVFMHSENNTPAHVH